MASGWLLLTGGALWTLNSLGAGVWLGHWLVRHNLLSGEPEEPESNVAVSPGGKAKNVVADEQDEFSPLAGEVSRGVAQAGATLRKAEWLSSVCEEAESKATSTIRTAVRELTGAVRTLHHQIGSIFAAFESLRSVRDEVEEPAAYVADKARSGIDLVGRRKRLGGFEPPPPPIRFPYPCQEWIAPCTDEQLPAAADFFAVQCRHLDKDGVAFYVDRVLAAETFVMSLAVNGLRTFMLARVLSEHAQPPGAQGAYMLECRFLKHVESGIYTWNPETAAIEAGSVAAEAGVG